jgi:hypothetical protein
VSQITNLTGWKNPKFYIRRKNDNMHIDTIELDFTNGEGLVVEYEDVTIEHELLDYSGENDMPDIIVEQLYIGTRYCWTINYTELLEMENGLVVKKLLDYRINNDMKFFLQPRTDNENIYEVVKVTDVSQLYLTPGGESSSGDAGFSMKWRTKHLIKDMKWQDPNKLKVYVLRDVV